MCVLYELLKVLLRQVRDSLVVVLEKRKSGDRTVAALLESLFLQ